MKVVMGECVVYGKVYVSGWVMLVVMNLEVRAQKHVGR